MAKLRAGVIGVGHLGQHHARLYSSLPDSTLVGVIDQDHERAALIGRPFDARSFNDVSDLLKHVDVVSVAVPTSAHYSVTKICLEAGKHVLVEKPIAVLPIEARELVELAKRNGCTLQVGHSERFNPIMQMMRPHIRRPTLFEGQRMGVYSARGTDVDVVLDLMIHDLDLVLSCNPGPVADVRAAGLSMHSSTSDVANAYIQFESGCVASLIASRVALKSIRQMRLFQSDGYVSIDFQSRRGVVRRRSVEPGGSQTAAVEEFQGGDVEPLRLQLESFLQAVRVRSCPVVSGEDGTAALELAHRVLSAIKTFGQRHA
jgi:predicted dehydrogenase